MRLIALLSSGLLFFFSAAAQTVPSEASKADSAGKKKYNGSLNYHESARKSFGLDAGFDFGWNRFVGAAGIDPNFKPEKGPDFSFSLLKGRISLKDRRRLGITTSLGLDYNTYHFREGIIPDADKGLFSYHSPVPVLQKSLVRTTWFRLPVLLSCKPWKRDFYIHAGLEGGWLLSTKAKQKYRDDTKEKQRGDFNFNPYRFGSVFRIGKQGCHLYTRYYFTDLFKNSAGAAPGVRDVDFGISLGNL